MLTTAVGTRKHSMTSRFARLAAGAAVSVALMTTAAPAMAMEPPEPRGAPTDAGHTRCAGSQWTSAQSLSVPCLASR